MKLRHGLILLFLIPPLAGCEQLGFEDPAVARAREEAEGRAMGGACRQTARPLEECYQINRRAPKAAIYAGWRDMDGYMRENNIAEIASESSAKPAPKAGRPLESAETAESQAEQKAAAETAPAEPVKKTRPALKR